MEAEAEVEAAVGAAEDEAAVEEVAEVDETRRWRRRWGGGYGGNSSGRGGNYGGGGFEGRGGGGSYGRDDSGYAQVPPPSSMSYGGSYAAPPSTGSYGAEPPMAPPSSYGGGRPNSLPPTYGVPPPYGGDGGPPRGGPARGGPPGGYDGGYGGPPRGGGGYGGGPPVAESPVKVKQCDENCDEMCDNSRIYISNLPPDVTTTELQELFGGIGQRTHVSSTKGVHALVLEEADTANCENDESDFWQAIERGQLVDRKSVGRIKQKRGYKDQWPYNIKIYTDDSGNSKGDACLSYEDPSAAHSAGEVRALRGAAIRYLENRRFIRRTSDCIPVRMIEPEESNKRSVVVYFDLPREECVNMCNLGINRYSQEFQLGKQKFFLRIGSRVYFTLELTLREPFTDIEVMYVFSVRRMPREGFVIKRSGTFPFISSKRTLCISSLFGKTTWPSLIASDSPFFINGMLHLKAELTIK
ncbi:BTB/POZ domain-containing protein POB1 [Acorus calamus]|uniref:BTB/POZ domain-containing protein POB1 n=1 Tax=Acorus calamus TaxID=4465 RepID=A0AAV9F3N7_ACOCL|nr:BTB/POZ domain-containing protein POB1 [Acorus calamus]